jgi:hypothetical protein
MAVGTGVNVGVWSAAIEDGTGVSVGVPVASSDTTECAPQRITVTMSKRTSKV